MMNGGPERETSVKHMPNDMGKGLSSPISIRTYPNMNERVVKKDNSIV